MYFRKKTSGGRAYLQIVESRREGAVVRQQAITALYRFGPTPEPGREWPILPGALAATTLWLAASEGFSAYVARLADFDLTYGPLATLAGVMLWFWVSSFVVLLGAAVNVEMRAGELG